MQTDIRQKLHQFIDNMEDKKAEAIYLLFENEINADLHRYNLVMRERENYLRGVGESKSWEDVKEMATDNTKRHGL